MTNKLKNKRGFSLVELMVVVAIMGTLASIAIPAFNEYRRSAKKASYRADLSSLHKGWLAFGVELDSFCDRDTSPQLVSIRNVGMEPLLFSKLYGSRLTTASTASCSESAHTTEPTCDNGDSTNPAGIWTPVIPAGIGPGKENFIGFGASNCTGVPDAAVQVKNSSTMADAQCILNTASYSMGVYGHVSGDDYFGVSINNNGVLSPEHEDATADAAESNCS